MNVRRALLRGLAGALALGRIPTARARPGAPVRRIGVLALSPEGSATAVLVRRLLREALRRVGFVEGADLIVEWRFAAADAQRLEVLAEELVRLDVALIVALQNDAIAAALRATRRIPIVMAFGSAPVEAGFVRSLARPGGNVTGVVWVSFEIAGKNLAVLRQALPHARRVAYLANPTVPGHPGYDAATASAAGRLGIELLTFGVTRAEEIGPALRRIAAARPDALMVVPDSVLESRVREIAEFALRQRLPTLGTGPQLVEAGGLLYYGPEVQSMIVRTAGYVDRILQGAAPADLPVEMPTHFELVINRGTAKAIGAVLPPDFVARADRVVE